MSQEDYDNLYEVEFAPIIEFYKNGGKIKLHTSIDDSLKRGLKRLTQDHKYSTPTDQNPSQTLKNSLLKIEKAKQNRGVNYFQDISKLETDEKGRINQASFLRHARKDRNLPGLTLDDVDGKHWYGSRSIELVNQAYVMEAGFKKPRNHKNGTPIKYEKDNNLIFLGEENGGKIDEIFKEVFSSLETDKKAQIFIPINHSNVHWSTLEVEVTKGTDGKFSIQNSYFDPSGAGAPIKRTDDLVLQSAQNNFGQHFEKLQSHGYHTKRQVDGSSCGPISSWYVGQRAKGLSCGNKDESFEPGALDLRLAQIRCISKNIGGEEAQTTQRSYNKPRITVASSPESPNTTEAQKKCEHILMKLNEVKNSEFSFFHSSIRGIFVAELEKFYGASEFPAAKDTAELFQNVQTTIESKFLSGSDAANFLKSVVTSFENNDSQALKMLSDRYKEDLSTPAPPSKPAKTAPAEKIFLTAESGKKINIEKAAIEKLGSVFSAAVSSRKIPREKRKELFSDLKKLAIQGLSTKALIAKELDKEPHEKVTQVESVNFNEKSETAEKIKVGEKNITVETDPKADSSGKLKIKFGERYVRKEFENITFEDGRTRPEEFGNNSFANCKFTQYDLSAIKGKTIKFANCTFDKNCTLPFDLEALDTIGFSGCKFSEDLVKNLSPDIKNKIGIEGADNDGFYSTPKVQYIPQSDLKEAKDKGTKLVKPSTIPFTSGLKAQLKTAPSERTAS